MAAPHVRSSSSQHYELYDEDGNTVNGAKLHRMQRAMVSTMLTGDSHCANSDISLMPHNPLTIPAGLRIFYMIDGSNVLLFGKLQAHEECLMLFLNKKTPYIFTDVARAGPGTASLLQEIKNTVDFRKVNRAMKKDIQTREKVDKHMGVDLDDGDSSSDSEGEGRKTPEAAGPKKPETKKPETKPERPKTPDGAGDPKKSDHTEALRALSAFLGGEYLEKGHPNDAEVQKFRDAIEYVLSRHSWSPIHLLKELNVIGSAMRGWFREVLDDHPNIPSFADALASVKSLHSYINSQIIEISSNIPPEEHLKAEHDADNLKEIFEEFKDRVKDSFEMISTLEETKEYAKAKLVIQSLLEECITLSDTLGELADFQMCRAILETSMKMIEVFENHAKKEPPPEADLIQFQLFMSKMTEKSKVCDLATGEGRYDDAAHDAQAQLDEWSAMSGKFGHMLHFQLVKPGLEFLLEKIRICELKKNEIDSDMEESDTKKEAETPKGASPRADTAPEIRVGSICKRKGISTPVWVTRVPRITLLPVVFTPGETSHDKYASLGVDRVLRGATEDIFLTFSDKGDLTLLPDKDLTPLQMTCRTTFDPNSELRHVGILGPTMDVVAMNAIIQQLPCKDKLDVLNGNSEEFQGKITWKHIHTCVHRRDGWFEDDTFKAAVIPILCRMYGGIVFQSNSQQIQDYFTKQNLATKPKFLVLDSQTYIKKHPNGNSLFDHTAQNPLSPRSSKLSIKTLNLTAFDFIILPISNAITLDDGTRTYGSHWYMGRIDIRRKSVSLFDSSNDTKAHAKHFDDLLTFTTDLFVQKHASLTVLRSPFGDKLTDAENLECEDFAKPRLWCKQPVEVAYCQRDGSACGVYVSMFMAYHMSGNRPEMMLDVKQDNIPRFRDCLTRLICETETGAPVGRAITPPTPSEVVGYGPGELRV